LYIDQCVTESRPLRDCLDRLELLEANIASCYYLLGNAEASLALFENCLNARSFSGASVLHGLSSDGLFLVSLPSAGAYARLMALNAGWSAMRVGRKDLPARFLRPSLDHVVGIGRGQLMACLLESSWLPAALGRV
jgi:hypothetical protein